MTAPRLPERVALVLGGGGLKGFAHIGAIRALRERGVRPTVMAGTSIGSLIAAAYVGDMSSDEMEQRALAVKKKDLFKLDRVHMLTQRMHAPSLYHRKPLETLVSDIVPQGTFAELRMPLLVNTVDLERAAPVVWGLKGLRDVTVADAVYASCALPGFFPPHVVAGRTCADGGVIDNLPAAAASHGMDAVIAVDVGSTEFVATRDVKDKGFAQVFMRAAQTMMRTLQLNSLALWNGPPLLLVRPEVWKYGWFAFNNTRRMIDAGYAAMHAALDQVGESMMGRGGVHPQREVELAIDREECTGCTLCASLAPGLVRMDESGKARLLRTHVVWSRADGDFVHRCPTKAIKVSAVEGDARRNTMEYRTLTDEEEPISSD
jgi:NTE family protein